MGHIKANRDPEVTHFCQCGEVIDQSVVAKECSTFGEHGGAGVLQLANDAGHFAGGHELPFFDIHGSTGGGSGLEQVCLAAKKCWDLQNIYGFTRCFALLRKVHIRGDGAVKRGADPLQFGQAGLDSRPAVRAET